MWPGKRTASLQRQPFSLGKSARSAVEGGTCRAETGMRCGEIRGIVCCGVERSEEMCRGQGKKGDMHEG